MPGRVAHICDMEGGECTCDTEGGECHTPHSLVNSQRKVGTHEWFATTEVSSCIVAVNDVSGAQIPDATATKTYIFH